MSKLTVHLVRAAHGNELIALSVSQGGRRAPAGRCRRVLALPRSWSLAQRQRRKGCFHQLYHLPLHEAEVWPRGFSGARSPRRSSPARLCLPASGARAASEAPLQPRREAAQHPGSGARCGSLTERPLTPALPGTRSSLCTRGGLNTDTEDFSNSLPKQQQLKARRIVRSYCASDTATPAGSPVPAVWPWLP